MAEQSEILTIASKRTDDTHIACARECSLFVFEFNVALQKQFINITRNGIAR